MVGVQQKFKFKIKEHNPLVHHGNRNECEKNIAHSMRYSVVQPEPTISTLRAKLTPFNNTLKDESRAILHHMNTPFLYCPFSFDSISHRIALPPFEEECPLRYR